MHLLCCICISWTKHPRFLRKNLSVRSKLYSLDYFLLQTHRHNLTNRFLLEFNSFVIRIKLLSSDYFSPTRDNYSRRRRAIRRFIKSGNIVSRIPGPGKIAPTCGNFSNSSSSWPVFIFLKNAATFPPPLATSRNSINRSMNYSRGCGDSCLHHLLHNLPSSFIR